MRGYRTAQHQVPGGVGNAQPVFAHRLSVIGRAGGQLLYTAAVVQQEAVAGAGHVLQQLFDDTHLEADEQRARMVA